MITFIEGSVINSKRVDRYSILELFTSGGVGYEISVPDRVVGDKKKMSLYVSHIVREDSQTLYGFLDRKDRDLFNLLISVSGVGPKTGIAIMSTFETSAIVSMILADDSKTLGKSPGLGSKGSQKIILELKNKVGDLGISGVEYCKGIEKEVVSELKTALKSLGFSTQQVNAYVDEAEKILGKGYIPLEELLKMVLKQ